jgi:hypothetical protein
MRRGAIFVPTLTYVIPASDMPSAPNLEADLKEQRIAILEQLPETQSRLLTRHVALGQLVLRPMPDYGFTIVENKPTNPLLNAIGFSRPYATIADLFGRGGETVKIVVNETHNPAAVKVAG